MGKKKAPKHVKKQRKWIVTDWCTAEDGDWQEGIKRWQGLEESKLRYAVWVVETGKDNKPHIQGFLHFNRPIALTTVKSRLQSKSVHVETVINDDAAAHYCSKPHQDCSCKHCVKQGGERFYGPVEVGTRPDYKTKSGLSPTDELALMVNKGLTDAQIAEEAPWAILRHSRGINALRFATMQAKSKEWRSVEVILLLGDAGTGKTAWAIQDSADGYYKPDLSKKEIWFDGYQGERTLILDDFRGSSCKFEQLLKLLDGHHLTLPIKGGHTYAMWTRVILTSNTTPEEWYQRLSPNQSEYSTEEEHNWRAKEANAFERRISLKVEDIDEKADYPLCIELVTNKVAQARTNSSEKKGNSEAKGNQALLSGLW